MKEKELRTQEIELSFDAYVDCSRGELTAIINRNEKLECPTCGCLMRVIHRTDFGMEVTVEQSDCVECGHVPPKVIHRLQ